jgi:hypothetical protein
MTQFDVYNAMPENTIDIFMHTAGGKQVGRGKTPNAIIEVMVDNETFQDFAFQKTYGHAKNGHKMKYFILYAVDADAYEATKKKLESKSKRKSPTPKTIGK